MKRKYSQINKDYLNLQKRIKINNLSSSLLSNDNKNLIIKEKCNEFINYVNINNKLPKTRDNNKFSDGVKMGYWWHNYKIEKKGNKEYYKDLLTNKILKNDY